MQNYFHPTSLWTYLIRVILSFALFFLSVTDVFAAPAAPIVVTLYQPDGFEFQAVPWGDEWLNGMETAEGYTILLSPESKYWVYAQPTADDHLAPRLAGKEELVVGRDDPSSLSKHVRPQLSQAETERIPFQAPSRGAESRSPNTGEQKVLVLLVAFQNQSGQSMSNAWSDVIFGENASLRHYYDEASFGQLSLTPAEESNEFPNDGIVGWLALPYNHPNTRSNIAASSQSIAHDAIQAADPFVNFSAFDTNQDGVISFDELHVMIVVAGYETAYGGSDGTCSPSIWAHAWGFDNNAPIVDGVRIGYASGGGGYTQVGERHCEISDPPGHPATIGIIAHELGHELGWPDLYDTSSRSAGLGYWDVMSSGLWNYSGPGAPEGSSPALPNPWSRWYQGWITPIQTTASTLEAHVPPIQTSEVAFQFLDNPYGVDWVFNRHSGMGEYYLIENRQQMGYDRGLPGEGLLIWHIDEGVTFNNYANADPNHRLVDLIQADGLRELNLPTGDRGDAGDPFPGMTQNRMFNAASNPSSNLYSGALSGVSLTDISYSPDDLRAHFFVTTFNDVLPTDGWVWSSVESIKAAHLTNGCGDGNYCPQQSALRSEMAVFLLRAKYSDAYLPPAAEGVFTDVALDHWAVDWIEQLYREGITTGCSTDPLRYCPQEPVTRAEMAAFLARALDLPMP